MSMVNTRLGRLVLSGAPIVALVAAWHMATVAGAVSTALLPAPGTVVLAVFRSLGDPAFLGELSITLMRLLAGFSLAVVAGIGLALIGASNRNAGLMLMAVVQLLAPIPKIALYPAIVLVFGYESTPKILLVAIDAVFPIILATYQGLARVERKLIWSARAMGQSPLSCLLTVALPAALPSVLTGCRVALIVSCIVVFLAEMISSSDGLGRLLIAAARNFDTVNMFVPLLLISAIGLVLNVLLNALRKRLLVGY
ncbi:MAG: ABC transporter permease [Rhizobiaceae bacterium]